MRTLINKRSISAFASVHAKSTIYKSTNLQITNLQISHLSNVDLTLANTIAMLSTSDKTLRQYSPSQMMLKLLQVRLYKFLFSVKKAIYVFYETQYS